MRLIDADALPEIKMHVADGCYMAKEVSERVNAALIIARNNVRRAPTLSLNTLRDAIYEDAVAHGLWDATDYPTDCAWKVKDEVDELYDAASEWEDDGWEEDEENDNFSEELADVIIMALSVAGKLGIDIDAAIRVKMAINKTRPYRHEGEK